MNRLKWQFAAIVLMVAGGVALLFSKNVSDATKGYEAFVFALGAVIGVVSLDTKNSSGN